MSPHIAMREEHLEGETHTKFANLFVLILQYGDRIFRERKETSWLICLASYNQLKEKSNCNSIKLCY